MVPRPRPVYSTSSRVEFPFSLVTLPASDPCRVPDGPCRVVLHDVSSLRFIECYNICEPPAKHVWLISIFMIKERPKSHVLIKIQRKSTDLCYKNIKYTNLLNRLLFVPYTGSQSIWCIVVVDKAYCKPTRLCTTVLSILADSVRQLRLRIHVLLWVAAFTL